MQDQARTTGFQCKQCEVVCPSWPGLLEHVESHYQHEEERRFWCEQCGRGYRHAGSLVNHKKTHEVGSFQCPVCARELSNPLALKNHLRIHTPGKNYPCPVCGKAFRLATQLATHQKLHGPPGEPLGPVVAGSDETESGPDAIPGEASPGDPSGMLTGVPPPAPSNNPPPPPFLREVGDVLDPPGGSRDRDTFLEQDPSEQADSQASVTDSSPDCGLQPDAHLEAGVDKPSTEEDRPFKCNQCEKTYRHHGSLINHKKSHQLGAYECHVCYKQFNNLAALKSHLRIHSKSKGRPAVASPFSGAAAAELSAPQNGDASHFCHLCQVAFSSEAEFQDHVLLHNSTSLSLGPPDDFSDDLSYDYTGVGSPDDGVYAHPPLIGRSDEKEEAEEEESVAVVNGQMYTCAFCGESYSNLESLKAHYLTHDAGLQDEDAPPEQEEGNPEGTPAAKGEPKVNQAAAEVTGSDERRFKCQLCGKSYRHAGSLINHKRSHQTGVFQCSICQKHYPHLAALKSHLRIHKSKPPALPLSSEGDWLSPEPLTLEGQSYVLPFSSQVPDSGLAMPQDVALPAPPDDAADASGSVCFPPFDSGLASSCPASPPTPDPGFQAERHMCADCGETYSDIAGIKSHQCPRRENLNGLTGSGGFREAGDNADVEEDGNESPVPVGSRRRKRGPAQKHVEAEERRDAEEYGELCQCSVCGNHYASLSALRSHLRCHTLPGGAGRSPEAEDEGGLLICSACGESFLTERDLEDHQLSHESELAPLPPKPESKSHACARCGAVCDDYYPLGAHRCAEDAGGEAAEAADAGGEGKAESPGALQESPDAADRPHRCEQCGRAYRHAGSLLNHKKSHKTGVFRCFVCQKRFYNLLALKNHQRVHFDIKRHKCSECGKAFKIHKQLVSHQRTHEENRARAKELNRQLQRLLQANGGTAAPAASPPPQPDLPVKPTPKRSQRQNRGRVLDSSLPGAGRCDFPGPPPPPGNTLSAPSAGAKPPADPELPPPPPPLAGDPQDERPYACDQCGRTYRHAGSLVNHKNSHKVGQYYCTICSNTYPNQLAMKNHLRNHFAVKKHCCADCGKAFRGRRQLSSHERSRVCRRKRGRDPRRPRRAAQRRAGGPEAEPEAAGGPPGARCARCGQAFASAAEMAGHACARPPRGDGAGAANGGAGSPSGAAAAPEERPFRCDVCGRTYRHAGSLLNHKNTHKTGRFDCAVCAKAFSNPMALKNHLRIHTQKRRHSCPDCGKAFRLAGALRSHQKVHCGRAPAQCADCGKAFLGSSGLRRHRCAAEGGRSPEHGGAEEAGGGERRFTCEQCGRSYRHAGSLLNHKNTHTTGLYRCAACAKEFSNLLALKNHRRIHTEARRFACPDCGKAFRVSAHLLSHRRVHARERPRAGPELGSGPGPACRRCPGPEAPPGGEKAHVCEHCGRTYRHAGSLLNHKNSHKTGSFSCAACQKQFSNLMALKNHRRIHTEPKRYQCPDCGKAFRVSTQLICHRRVHTREKPFACPLCGKCFSSKSNLRHHQKVHKTRQAGLGLGLGLGAPLDGGFAGLAGLGEDGLGSGGLGAGGLAEC